MGFVNSGEYKLMGLAPYGEPKYKDIILKNLIDVKEDGFNLDQKYFNYSTGLIAINDEFSKLFEKPRVPDKDKLSNLYGYCGFNSISNRGNCYKNCL